MAGPDLPTKLAQYECCKCKHAFTAAPGPTVCKKCGHEYVKWANYEEMRARGAFDSPRMRFSDPPTICTLSA